MSDSDSSSLSSVQSIDSDDGLPTQSSQGGIDAWLKKGASASSPPPKKKRQVSPVHEYVLADSPDIAFIVMFRARFSAAFPKSLLNFGPQDIENGVVDATPGEHVERLLCALLGLVLNRKKDVERGHYQRALEEAVQTHASQWPTAWGGKNPLHGGGNVNNMSAQQRLTLLKALILWSLNSSEAVQAIIKESYKQNRHEDDLNQPLSVQPWGRDGDKRRYWLVEGQDDTYFRLYRESNPALKTNTWWSIAATIDELKLCADKLGEDGSQAARRLRDRITMGIPRFEAGEEKRKRRDYRLARKAQFTRAEPGFSMYEGRTRGKRIRYTFSDEEDGGSDAQSNKRSTRHSGISTPAEPAGPTFTASGRQVKSRYGGAYGETLHSGQHDTQQSMTVSNNDVMNEAGADVAHLTSRTRSSRAVNEYRRGYNMVDEMDDESDATSSGNEWDGGDHDDDDDVDDTIADDDDDVEMSDSGASIDEREEPRPRSLVVSLRYRNTDRAPEMVQSIVQLNNGSGLQAGDATAHGFSALDSNKMLGKPHGERPIMAASITSAVGPVLATKQGDLPPPVVERRIVVER